MVEYLDPEIANEGHSADSWSPGAWTNSTPVSDDEYQPEFEAPHINDYAAFKKHKHYRQYFRPYRYVAFPAVVYHKTLGEKLVRSKEDVEALGPGWGREPFVHKMDMSGKSIPTKSETQKLAETVAAAVANKTGGSTIDPSMIASIVAAVMAATKQEAAPAAPTVASSEAVDAEMERTALIELADKEGVKIDGRWSNQRIKEALGL